MPQIYILQVREFYSYQVNVLFIMCGHEFTTQHCLYSHQKKRLSMNCLQMAVSHIRHTTLTNDKGVWRKKEGKAFEQKKNSLSNVKPRCGLDMLCGFLAASVSENNVHIGEEEILLNINKTWKSMSYSFLSSGSYKFLL